MVSRQQRADSHLTSAHHRLAANALATALGQIVLMGAAFLLAPMLIHAFGASGFGVYTLATSISSFMLLFDLGLGQTVEKRLAEFVAVGRLEEASVLLASVRRTYFGLGFAVALTEVLLAALAPRLFRISSAEVEQVRQLLLVMAVGAVVWWPLSLGARVLGGLQRYTRVGPVTAGMALANALGAAVVVWLRAGPVVLALIAQCVALGGAYVMHRHAQNEMAAHGVRFGRADRSALASAFVFAWPVFLLQLAVAMLYHQADRLLLGVFAGSVAVTLYEGPSRLVALLQQLIGFGNTALMPFASQLEASRRDATLGVLLMRASRYVCAFVAPLAMLFALLARPLLVHWLGASFIAAEVPTVLLAGVQVLLVTVAVGHTFVVATGKLAGRMPVILGVVSLNLALSVLFVRPWGVSGVALGTVLASLVDLPLHVRYLQRHIGFSPRAFAKEVLLPVYPLLLLPAASAIAARCWGLTDTLLGTLATLGISAVAYWIAFLLVSVPPPERDELFAIAGSFLSLKRWADR